MVDNIKPVSIVKIERPENSGQIKGSNAVNGKEAPPDKVVGQVEGASGSQISEKEIAAQQYQLGIRGIIDQVAEDVLGALRMPEIKDVVNDAVTKAVKKALRTI